MLSRLLLAASAARWEPELDISGQYASSIDSSQRLVPTSAGSGRRRTSSESRTFGIGAELPIRTRHNVAGPLLLLPRRSWVYPIEKPNQLLICGDGGSNVDLVLWLPFKHCFVVRTAYLPSF